MASVASALEELPGRKYHPEPNILPDMNQEQTWAWAMDNFEALSHPSCQHPWCYGPGKPNIAIVMDKPAFVEERGQKCYREPHVEEPMAEISESLWGPQEVGASSRRTVQWALNQPKDDKTLNGGDMLAPSEFWSQGSSQK